MKENDKKTQKRENFKEKPGKIKEKLRKNKVLLNHHQVPNYQGIR